MAVLPTITWLVRVTYRTEPPPGYRSTTLLTASVQSELTDLGEARALAERILERARAHPELLDPVATIERRRDGVFIGVEPLEDTPAAEVAASIAAARAALARHPCAQPDVTAPVVDLERRREERAEGPPCSVDGCAEPAALVLSGLPGGVPVCYDHRDTLVPPL